MLIGKRVKDLRKARNMSLSELAKLSGVQIATLSRMENMRMVGTLESHMKIAQSLGVPLPQLYNDVINDEKAVDVKNTKGPADVFVHSEKSSYEILTPSVLSKKMMPVVLKIEPGGKTNSEQSPAGAEKFIFVLEGMVQAYIGEKTYSLAKHNTLYFDASVKHYFVNLGKGTARAISVVTPVSL